MKPKVGAITLAILFSLSMSLPRLAAEVKDTIESSPTINTISPELRAKAAASPGGVLKVFIVLRNQPQRQILKRLQAVYDQRMKGAGGEYQ